MTDFQRFAPAIAIYFAASNAVPLGFGAVVIHGGSPVTPDTYGPLVYAIPALVWVGAQLALSIFATVSAWKEWPIMTMWGATGLGLLMVFFAAAAVMAGAPGTILVFGAGGWMAPVCGCIAWVSWQGRNGR